MRTSPEPSVPALGRRTLLKGLSLGGAVAAVPGLAACTTPPPADPAPAPAGSPSTSPSAAATESGEITAAGVQRGLDALPEIIERYQKRTGVPGVAFSVVYEGEVRYLEGSGIREVGKTEKVDADTVFQLASVSKPISATVVAAAFTKKVSKLDWDEPAHPYVPALRMADPWVQSHVTTADLFAHRSGLPDHSGNLLEDLGYDRDEILERQRFYPLARFRDNYEYTNYGLTAGAVAIATASGRSWEDLAQEVLFGPLGMKSSSFRFADLQQRTNRAAMHKSVRGKWVPNLSADYDPQAPAGSASSSIRDMSVWLTMLLAEGKPVTDLAQLQRMWRPAIVWPGVPALGASAQFYGLGWNVSYEPTAELRASHSGAFGQGAATSVVVIPSKGLALAGLTNGNPVGLPEAIGAEFMDIVRYGKSSRDWLEFIGPYITPEVTADQEKYSEPAVDPKPAKKLDTYVGSYQNRLFGRLTVSLRNGALSFTVGPSRQNFALRHHSGDEFYFTTTGEDDSGFSGALFKGSGNRSSSLRINAWNAHDLGTFVRS